LTNTEKFGGLIIGAFLVGGALKLFNIDVQKLLEESGIIPTPEKFDEEIGRIPSPDISEISLMSYHTTY